MRYFGKIKHIKKLFKNWEILRGMTSYAIFWPTANLIQQAVVEKRESYDWKSCLRFSVFGAFVFGPVLYSYVRISVVMWPITNFQSSLSKTIVEAALLDPLVIIFFLVGMPLLEGRPSYEALNELKRKFYSTYKVSLIVWPPVQIFNYLYVPYGYQVVVTSTVSFIWSIFLAVVHAS